MKVCLFGTYIPGLMISILKKRLELKNIEVVECSEDIHKNIFSVVSAFLKLAKKNKKIDYDIIIIPLWRGAIALPLAKIISRKPIVWYANASAYDGLINDRKTFKPNSIQAKFITFFEKLNAKLAHMIIKESYADIDYFLGKFGGEKKKFRRLFLSADEDLFPPCPFKETKQSFNVLYFGKFIPFHGVEMIIEAAKILSQNNDVIFKFCGEGQTKKEMEDLVAKYDLKNVKFLGYIPHESLLDSINESDVCLGVFGNTGKETRMITNKIYNILCSQKPLITLDTKAVKEIELENEKNSILIPREPKKLSDAILFLKNNPLIRQEIAEKGRKLFVNKLSVKETSKDLMGYLQELI
jgi:glycosyltransferase involved in cell wall biosynthesis